MDLTFKATAKGLTALHAAWSAINCLYVSVCLQGTSRGGIHSEVHGLSRPWVTSSHNLCRQQMKLTLPRCWRRWHIEWLTSFSRLRPIVISLPRSKCPLCTQRWRRKFTFRTLRLPDTAISWKWSGLDECLLLARTVILPYDCAHFHIAALFGRLEPFKHIFSSKIKTNVKELFRDKKRIFT